MKWSLRPMFHVLMSQAINLNSFQDGCVASDLVQIGVLPNRPAVSTDPNLTLLFILRIWCDPHQIVNAKDGDGSLWKLGTSWVTPGGTHNGSVQIWMQSNTGYHCFRLQRSSDCRILKAPRRIWRCRFTLKAIETCIFRGLPASVHIHI